ncbi:unnamed protein product [Pedinophyceae sp. YPF-701]|nr:unnamed protein product [Pedinophyceae sp. YPF-701]
MASSAARGERAGPSVAAAQDDIDSKGAQGAAGREEGAAPREEKPKPPPRPNYFYAVQLSHEPTVRQAIEGVQTSLRAYRPRDESGNGASAGSEDPSDCDACEPGPYAPFCVDPASAHITLAVMALETEAHVEGARRALEAAFSASDTERATDTVSLPVRGLGTFGGREAARVVFLEVPEGPEREWLEEVAFKVRESLLASDIADTMKDQAFVPHCTIAKPPPPRRGRRRPPKSIPKAALGEHWEVDGGRAAIATVQLCRMSGRRPGGYYHVVTEVRVPGVGAAQAGGEAAQGV